MLRTIGFISFVLLLLSSCKSGPSGEEKDRAQLDRLNRRYDSALIAKDTALLGRLYADSFVFISAEGQTRRRQEQISSVLSNGFILQAGTSDEVETRLLGDVAIMNGRFLAKGIFKGNPVEIRERYSTIWVRRDTTWQLLQEHASRIE